VGPFAMSGGDPFGPFANDVISSHETRKLDDLILNAHHDFGSLVTLTSITAWKHFETANREDEDGANLPDRYFDTESAEHHPSCSQEFRLSHAGDRFHWIAGVSYFQENAYQESATTALTDSIDTAIDTVLESQGQPDFPIFHILQGMAGLPVLGQT